MLLCMVYWTMMCLGTSDVQRAQAAGGTAGTHRETAGTGTVPHHLAHPQCAGFCVTGTHNRLQYTLLLLLLRQLLRPLLQT
jgi:hypothetical protein